MDERLEKVGAYWDARGGNRPRRGQFWNSRTVLKDLNRRICGKPLPGHSAGLHERLRQRWPGRRFARAVSVGGGAGGKEMALVRAGLVERFDIFELSAERIAKGEARARSLGLTETVRFWRADAFAAAEGPYDLAHWDASLHHMFDTAAAVRWSREVLAPGGVFYMHEFVGPSQMQYTDTMLSWASRVRGALPPRYRARARGPLPLEVTRRDPAELAALDPSECVDSANILPAVRATFPAAEIVDLGGIGYFIALQGMYGNFDESKLEDRLALGSVLLIDEALASAGFGVRAAALAER